MCYVCILESTLSNPKGPLLYVRCSSPAASSSSPPYLPVYGSSCGLAPHSSQPRKRVEMRRNFLLQLAHTCRGVSLSKSTHYRQATPKQHGGIRTAAARVLGDTVGQHHGAGERNSKFQRASRISLSLNIVTANYHTNPGKKATAHFCPREREM